MFPFAQVAYYFDIGYTASSRSYLTPKLANVLENPTKKRDGNLRLKVVRASGNAPDPGTDLVRLRL